MSVERVGGVEPETVTAEAGFAAQSKAYCDMADQMCRERNEAQRELSVQRATLRSVEEELRQTRAAHEDAMLAEGHTIETLEADVDRLSRLFDASWADRDRLTRELRQAREERDAERRRADQAFAERGAFRDLMDDKERAAIHWRDYAAGVEVQRNDLSVALLDMRADRDRLAAAIRAFFNYTDGVDDNRPWRKAEHDLYAALSPVGQDDPGQETIDGDPQPLGSTITICTGCGYIVRAGDEGFHRECDDGVLIDYERAGDPGQEQGAEWTEYEEGYHDGAMAERKDWQEGGPGSTFLGDRAAAAAGVRSQGPLLTEEDWQSFPTDPETRDTVLDYLAERGYLAVRDDDSEATR